MEYEVRKELEEKTQQEVIMALSMLPWDGQPHKTSSDAVLANYHQEELENFRSAIKPRVDTTLDRIKEALPDGLVMTYSWTITDDGKNWLKTVQVIIM